LSLPKLTNLCAADRCSLDDNILLALTQLLQLDLENHSAITPVGLAPLARLGRLQFLASNGLCLTPQHLAHLSNLTYLALNQNDYDRITESELEHAMPPRLEALKLGITEYGCKTIFSGAVSSSLQLLDAGFAHSLDPVALLLLTQLRILDVPEHVPCAVLRSLTSIEVLTCTLTSEEDLMMLVDSLPHLRFLIDNGHWMYTSSVSQPPEAYVRTLAARGIKYMIFK